MFKSSLRIRVGIGMYRSFGDVRMSVFSRVPLTSNTTKERRGDSTAWTTPTLKTSAARVKTV